MYSDRLMGQLELGLQLAENGAPIPPDFRENLTNNLEKEIRAAEHLNVADVTLPPDYQGSREAYAIELGLIGPDTLAYEMARDQACRDRLSPAIGHLALEQVAD